MRRRRFGDLFEQVASLGNLFAAAKKALRGRGLKMPAVAFAAKDRSANGTSASVGLAGRSTRSNRRSWLGRMRPDRGGAAELPIHAQGRIFLVGADRP